LNNFSNASLIQTMNKEPFIILMRGRFAPRIGRRINIRFLSGAARRPSSGCNRRASTRASSRSSPRLIRRPLSC
jgi:hypothetical protein